jgi:hypothetical protein
MSVWCREELNWTDKKQNQAGFKMYFLPSFFLFLFLSFFLSFIVTSFLSLTSVYLLTVGLANYYCTWLHSTTHTLAKIPLDEWSARHTALSLTTHYTHKTQIHPPSELSRNPTKWVPPGSELQNITSPSIRMAVSETHAAERTNKFNEHKVV